jgi:HK97 family phage portal protein
VLRSTLLAGAAYGLIVGRDGAGMAPSQIELVDPVRVGVVLKPDRLTVEYRFDGQVVRRGDELWVFNGHRFPGIPHGLSPVRYAAETIGTGIAAGRYGATFFGHEARPGGVLTTDKSLTDVEIDQLQARWKESMVGVRRTALLEHGVDYKPIQVPPEEAQFLETQQWTVQQVAMVYGVPPELIAAAARGESVTYANMETRPLDLYRFALVPWLVRLEAALAELLPRGMVARFNPRGLLRADQKTRYESYAIALTNGFLTVDEVRAQEDLPPLPAGAAPDRPRLEAVS